MKVHKIEPPTIEQVQAQCAEMRRLQAEGKLQQLPAICTPAGGVPQRPPGGANRQIGV